MANLEDVASRAKSDLAWLAASHLIYKTLQPEVLRPAKAVLIWPEQMVSTTLALGTPQEVRTHWERLVAYFKDFCSFASGAPADDPGHYLNKVATVYAAAIVEGFLRDAFYAKFETKLPGSSIARQVADIQGKPLFGQREDPETSPPKVYIADFENCASDALFLAALRNAIVHNQGFVNDIFLRDVGYHPNPAKKEIWDHHIWKTRGDFEDDYAKTERDASGRQRQRQVCLDVAKVVIPYIHHSADFVRKATQLLDGAVHP